MIPRCLLKSSDLPVEAFVDYQSWCSLSNEQLARHDVAYLNLLTAEGLPGSEALDVPAALAQIDRWAEVVTHNTAHWRRTYVPSDDCRTEAQFCMLALVTVLQRHLGVHYHADCMSGPYNGLDSRSNFLHGPLSDFGGTCCSLPILYLAVGRRLGYPLKLVPTIEHSFVRWDDPDGERFNVECAGVGFVIHDDEHYRNWPRVFSVADRAHPRWLRNLTPRQELAHHLAERGHCLLDNLRLEEAIQAYYFARQMDRTYRYFWAVASMIRRIVDRMQRFTPSPYFPWRQQLDIAAKQSVPSGLENYVEPARVDLHRILGLHEAQDRQRPAQTLPAGEWKPFRNQSATIPPATFSTVHEAPHVLP